MTEIVKVEEVLYATGPGEPIIGFTLHYSDGIEYPVGPVLLRHELDAIRADAYNRGYAQGADEQAYDNQMQANHTSTTE